jgi:hypothetical protein
MQDKIRHIEFLYQSQKHSLDAWREQALNAVHQEYCLPSLPLSSPPKEIISLGWKEDDNRLKLLQKFFIEKKIFFQMEKDYDIFFHPHFYNGEFIISAIKCKNIKKALWAFYVLQKISVITNEYLHIILPQHLCDKKGKPLNQDTLEAYLPKMRKAKKIPDFVRDMLLIFPSDSLPKSLLK